MADFVGPKWLPDAIKGDTGNVAGSFSSFSPTNLLSAETKQGIQGIDQTTGTKKKLTLVKRDTHLMTGQPDDTPDINFDAGSSFSIDGYRDGNAGDPQLELFHARSLGAVEQEHICSMTLSIPSGGGGALINAYTRFFLQAVSEAEQEKYQVAETFTGFYAFFYGKRPPIYRYSGTLLSDPNYRWNNDFKFVYENFFRGTSAVEFSAEVIMAYGGRVITGFPLSLTMQQDAMNDKGMPFSMDLLVVSHDMVGFSLDIDGLLQKKRDDLAKVRNKINAAQLSLQAGSGPGVRIADQVTNQVTPASAVTSLSNSSSYAGSISQRLVK